jgi:putative transposase
LLRVLHAKLLCLLHLLLETLKKWTTPCSPIMVIGAMTDLTRSKSGLLLENALLRQQIIVLQRQVKRPKLTWWERAWLVLFACRLNHWSSALLLVKPETLLRWHRDLFRFVWKHKSKPRTGGGWPTLSKAKVALIRQMANENLLWGAERIRGELLKLGLSVAKSSIQKYAKGRSPHPRSQTWRTFLHNHAAQIWACDFLQGYDLWFRALFVFVIIELASRRVVHIAVTYTPTSVWVAQQLREATPFGAGPKYLVRDNDKKYGAHFDRVAQGTGIQVLHTPIAAPRANAVCERFLGSLRRECLDHMLLIGERACLRVVKEYARYFNLSRPHQGLHQRIPAAPEPPDGSAIGSAIVRIPVLHGLHHDYQRRVA